MRQFLMFAAAALIVGSVVAHYADEKVVTHSPSQAAVTQPAVEQPRQVSVGQHKMELLSENDGHFRVNARVDGARVGFMVDTGASLVVLRATDAASVGIHPMPKDFTANVTTANGSLKAARAQLDRIEIGDITVFDVPALV